MELLKRTSSEVLDILRFYDGEIEKAPEKVLNETPYHWEYTSEMPFARVYEQRAYIISQNGEVDEVPLDWDESCGNRHIEDTHEEGIRIGRYVQILEERGKKPLFLVVQSSEYVTGEEDLDDEEDLGPKVYRLDDGIVEYYDEDDNLVELVSPGNYEVVWDLNREESYSRCIKPGCNCVGEWGHTPISDVKK